jgi:predicted phosphoribosyltransferase
MSVSSAMIFTDRTNAGSKLGKQLIFIKFNHVAALLKQNGKNENGIILALTRGATGVAVQVSKELGTPVDRVVVRGAKITFGVGKQNNNNLTSTGRYIIIWYNNHCR